MGVDFNLDTCMGLIFGLKQEWYLTVLSNFSTWVWIIICAGILFVLGCVLACIFRRKICKLKNNTTGKQGLKETTKLQKVALLGKCNIEKVGQHVYNFLLDEKISLIIFSKCVLYVGEKYF